ncbi:hypothetical protein COHA_002812 [Chlorella ohadii]|uniref:Uncharacterized protein n=1 Tax=Chlorella ohadii TaxID=2649997 RepID=A0AAD5DWU7_9CHLO|nr:hypothetical protein COHA_002812 [Chlorella ohadii]
MQQMLVVARELGLLPTCSDCSAGQSQPSWVPPLACDEPSTPPSHCQAGHSTRHELEVSDTAQSSGAERSPPALGYGGESEPPRHQDQDQHRQQHRQQQHHQHAALMPHCTAAAAAAAGPCGREAWPPGVPMPVDMPQLWQPLPPPPQLGFPALLPMAAEGSGAVTPPARLAPAGVPVPPAPQRVRAAAQQQDQQPRMQQQQQQQQQQRMQQQPQLVPSQRKVHSKQQQQKPPQQSQQQQQRKRKGETKAGRPPKSSRRGAEQLGERRQETAALPSYKGLDAENIGAALLVELRRQLSAQQAADAEEWHLEQRRLLQAAQAEQRRQLELAQQAQMLQLERAQLLLRARRVTEQQQGHAPVPGGAAVLPVAPAQLLGRQLSHQLHQPAEGQQQQHGIEQLERRRSAEAEAFLRSVSLKQGQL